MGDRMGDRMGGRMGDRMGDRTERMTPPSLGNLTDQLRRLPGVGPKSAQRMALYLMQKDREGALSLGEALIRASKQTRACLRCNGFTEDEVCGVCLDAQRDAKTLCVVESPADMMAIEATGMYKGLYFVLMGRYAALDGASPDDLGVNALQARVQDGLVAEVILATNFTNEGEATAIFLQQRLRSLGVSVTRIARGVPIGGELEYTDPGTVARALLDRQNLKDGSGS